MSATLCLLCGRKRVETVCGDNDCRCTRGRGTWGAVPIIVTGLGWKGKDGRLYTTQPCGRAVPEKTEART